MGSYPRSRLDSDGSKYLLMSSMRTAKVLSLSFFPMRYPTPSHTRPSGYMKDHPGSLNLEKSEPQPRMSVSARSMNRQRLTGSPSVQM